jgi:hypothetical protein
MSSKSNPNFPLWKYVDSTKLGSGGTSQIKCLFCQAEWKGTYTRVKSHFIKIPKMGVDVCIGDPEDANRLTTTQIEQRRVEGKACKEVSTPCHNPKYSVDDDGDSNEDFNPFEDEVQFGDENVPSRASKSTTSQAHKKQKVGGLFDMFDAKGRDGVDLAISRFFLVCGIPFKADRSSYFEQMVYAINNGPMGYKPPSYEKLRTVLMDKEKTCLDKAMSPLKALWSLD